MSHQQHYIANIIIYIKGDDRFGWKDEKEEEKKELPHSPMAASLTGEEGKIDMPSSARLHVQPLGVEGQVGTAAKNDPRRFRMYFEEESKGEIEKRRRLAKTTPITPLPEREMEVGLEDVYGEGSVLEFPRRPPWTYSTTKAELLAQEEASFTTYLQNIHSKYSLRQLSYFEHNLEARAFMLNFRTKPEIANSFRGVARKYFLMGMI